MEIKILAFIFALLHTVYCKPADPNDLDTYSYDDIQNDNNNNYGGDGGDYPDELEEGPEPEDNMPPLKEKPLTITTTEQEFIANLSGTIRLPCEITGGNHVQIWRKLNVNDQQSAVLFQEKIKMAAGNNMKLLKDGSLEISNLHSQDEGNYECAAMDTYKNSPKITHKVILMRPPTIVWLAARDNITTLKSGDTLELTCKATGFPKPAISWHKGPRRFPYEGENFTHPNIKHHDAGTYKCLADNKIGEPAFSFINIKVEYKPIITVERISVSSENNSQTELECIVHSEPKAQVVWTKDGVNIVNSERVQLVSEENRHNLLLKQLSDSDFGTYTCLASNYLGKSKKNIKLVKTPVLIRFTKSRTENREVVLTWEVQSKSEISGRELEYRRKGSEQWIPLEPEVTPNGNDVYSMKYVFSKGLESGDYEARMRSRNAYGWSPFSDIVGFQDEFAKHGHHKDHKSGHKHGKEKQITSFTSTPIVPSQPYVPAEHQESDKTGYVKDPSGAASETSGSSFVTPTVLPISIAALIYFMQVAHH